MKSIRTSTRFWRLGATAGLVIAVVLGCQLLRAAAVAQALGPDTDILYVGDGSDDTVKIFRASDGTSLNGASGAFIKSSGGLHGPMGLLIAGPELIVDNQDVNLPISGEISRYQLNNGSFAGTWISKSDPNAPFAPRGAVIHNGVLYVANMVTQANTPGGVLVFAGDGRFLGSPVPCAGSMTPHPRGIVVGPDGLLYVASDPVLGGIGGQVFVFDPVSLKCNGIFINDAGGPGALNRPEGLVFGLDGNLYVTSFCAAPSTCPTPSDIDSIRIYGGPPSPLNAGGNTGKLLGVINLDPLAQPIGQKRATAQALVFGPGGTLFLPITFRPAVAGQVVTCNVVTKACNGFTGLGTLGAPFYLTFGRTDSGTLAYFE